MINNQKRIAYLFVTLILLIGIGITVYLIRFTQVFKPKASDITTQEAVGLYGSTPICELDQSNCSDLSKFPKPSTGAIQTLEFLGFMYPDGSVLTNPSGVAITSNGLSQGKKTFFTKQMDYLWFDGGSFVTNNNEVVDFSILLNNIKELKNLAQNSLNSKFKIGIHAGAIASSNPLFVIWPSLVEDNFLHDSTGSRISYPGQPLFKFLYLQNEDTRRRLANGFSQIMNTYPLDGLLLDSFSSPHLILQQVLGNNNCREQFDCKSSANWFPYIKQTTMDIKAVLPNSSSKDIIYNGIFAPNSQLLPTWDGNMNQGFLNYTDGALIEHVHSILVDESIFKDYMEQINTATSLQKKILFFVQPQLFYQTHPTDNVSLRNPVNMTGWRSFLSDNNIPIELNLERFYLACYLLIQKNPYTYFGYHPGFVFSGDFDVYFYEDWNKDYGDPLDTYQITANGLYTRTYKNGFVVVNPTTQALPLQLQESNLREWDASSGMIASSQDVMIPPKSGKFFFKPKGRSPSPTSRIGDLDKDGDVDIFDFNIFVGDFPLKNLRSDVNKDQKVDIFDFNSLITNFGK